MTATPGAFAAASAVTRASARHDGAATYSAGVADGWDILGNANGGYLMAVAARAIADHVARPDPVSLTAHYLSPGIPGPLAVEVAELRSGRRFASARAMIRMGDGTPVLAALGSFADLSATTRWSVADSQTLIEAVPPDLPDVEDCINTAPEIREPGTVPNFMDRVELRLHPDDAGFREGRPSGRPRVRGWFRFPGGEPVDTIGLLCVLDAFPPTVFNAELPVNWVPTLEFTAHVRRPPAPGWLACEFTTRLITGGFLEEDGLVWDSTGAPVAQSRQLALVPRG